MTNQIADLTNQFAWGFYFLTRGFYKRFLFLDQRKETKT